MKVEGVMKDNGTLNRLGEVWVRGKAWRERYHLKPLFSVMMYIVIPLVAIYLIMQQYPLLAKERFYNMIKWIVPIGIGLFTISVVQERFNKGSRSRLALDGLFVILTMFWLYGFLGGQTIIHSTYGEWGFSVDVTPIVMIVLIGTSLNFIRDFLEFKANGQGLDIGPGKESEKVQEMAVNDDDMVTIYTTD